MTVDELEQSIRSRIAEAAGNEAQIYQLQRSIVWQREEQEKIEGRYILGGMEGANEKQRQAWLLARLTEDEHYQSLGQANRYASEVVARRERELRVSDRLRRLEMVLLQLHGDRRGEDHGTA